MKKQTALHDRRARNKRPFFWFAVLAIAVSPGAAAAAETSPVEVTVVLNTPDKREVKGVLKEVTGEGTITLTGAYGDQTFRQGQYLSALCLEPPEHAIARQSYLRGDYSQSLELYRETYSRYRFLGWGAVSLEGMANSYRLTGNGDAAIETSAKLLSEYPNYEANRRVKFALAQLRERKGELAAAVELFGQVAWGADDELSATSFRNMGSILYMNGKYEEALLQYLRVPLLYANVPGAPIAECLFRAGDCFEILADELSPQPAAQLRARARKYYSDVVARYPQSEFAKAAQLRHQNLTGGAGASSSDTSGTEPTEAGR